ncbi:c-type cytochrome [Pseudomonas sp. NY15437]|uniref:c-type cytochrome n=1 Tax=Pseudomonas sp. NY15437 TaxID=3400360 RepID=UPI003A85CD1E
MTRKTIWTGLGVLAAVGVALAFAILWRPAIAPRGELAAASQEQIRRGSLVVEAGDCAVCHTRPGGAYLAGGLGLVTPFGTLYSTNITPDARTGIGQWSFEAFERAMRHGISRDGHFLYPAFPYVHYRRMTDDDLRDAYAYLMSGPPVNAPATDNQMNFPMSLRPLVSFWNILFLRGETSSYDATRSAPWNRGRYLVEGAGHCAACHSPLNLLGAESSGEQLAGGVVDGWEAPDLRGMASAPAPWTHEQLLAYLRGEVAADHGAAAGPMRPVSLGLARLPSADVQAIAEYLLSLPPAAASAVPPAPRQAPADAQQNQGAALFQASCAGCHDDAAPMRQIDARPALATTSALRADSPRNFIKTVLEGLPPTPGQAGPAMPPFAASLDNRQLAQLAAYLRAKAKPQQPWQDLSTTLDALREQTP